MSEFPRQVQPRDCPYVGLDFYREESGAWFFGREIDRDKVITNLQAARLTLLYAESGVGKSSLLRAGVARHLRRPLTREGHAWDAAIDVPVVFSSWQDDPVLKLVDAIREAIRPDGEPGPELPSHRLDLAIEAAADAAKAGLFIILDQFEEYFLYSPHERVPGQFADELSRCVNRADLPANFLIAIREDAYAGLGDLFKGRIANVYGNYLHIDFLDRASAEKAIREPLGIYNDQPGVTERVGIQDELVEAVLDQVRVRDVSDGESASTDGGRVATPLLQLVMETIWQRDQAAGSDELRLATLQNLQGVEKIVDTHVWKALRTLNARERRIAIDMFDRLVTPSGGKIAEPVPDLARRTGHSEEQAGRVLDKLDHERIVRSVPAPPGKDAQRFRRYEIFHDVLTPTINRAIAVREERRRVRRFRRLTALAVFVLVAVLGVGAWINHLQTTQQNVLKGGQLTSAANAALDDDPGLSARLALQALNLHDTSAAETALRDALPELQAVRTLQDGTVVFSAAFDPVDPDKVISADKDGASWIWDVRTGRRLVRMKLSGSGAQNPGTADSVAFNPAGTRVAVGYGGGMVSLFDAASGQELQSVKLPNAINDVQFVGGLGELAIATQGGAGLWRLQDGSKCCDMLMQGGQANAIAVDPADPLKFAVATDSGTVIWTLSIDLRPLRHKSLDLASDNDAEFNPDGREVVTAATDGKARVYDLATFKEATTLDAGDADATSAAFSPDETKIVTAYSTGTARVWDTSTGLQLTLLVGNAAPVNRVWFSANGSKVVTASDDGTVRVWRAQPRELQTVFPSTFSGREPNLPYPVYQASYSPAGDRILAVDYSGAASVFTATGTPVYGPQHLPVVLYPGAAVESARFNHAGTQIITADSDGTVDLWHASNQDYAQIRMPMPIRLNGPAKYADFSRDGSRVVIITNNDTAQVRSATTGQLLLTLNPYHGFLLSTAAFSPDGRQVLTADDNGQVEVWRASDGQMTTTVGVPGPYINDVEFNQDGSEFVTTSDSGAVTVWDARNDRRLYPPINACPGPRTASFSHDGSMLVVACSDGRALVFDAATAQQLTTFSATRAGGVNSAAFSPDDRNVVLAVGGEDTGDVQVWSSGLATTSLQALERDGAGIPLEPGRVSSPAAEPAALSGTWTGSYVCAQGQTGLSLVMYAAADGTLAATFNFYAAPDNPSVPLGSFTMTGTYSADGINLTRSRWITQPLDYVMVNLSSGPLAGNGTLLVGKVTAPGISGCTKFNLRKSASSG